jgi:leader peptidase (prepilin peptidase)/N-methyltransferase
MLIFTLLLLSEIREPWPPLWLLESSARVLLGAWLFAFGASVGSFLNVVIYRLPRGMSLAHPGSHCPTCGHAIRGRDNLPVLSWLLLGGKCRDCRSPISPRYYYVELIVGLTFLLVAIFEAFLPQVTWLGTDVVRRPLSWHETLPLWTAYATHVVLLTTLIGAALIDRDGWRTPRGLCLPAIVLALVAGALWPETRRIVAIPGLTGPAWQVGLIEGAAGLAAGVACGTLVGLAWLGGSRGRSWPRSAPIMLLAGVGIVLGWQRVIVLAPLATLLFASLVIVVRLVRGQGVVPLAAVIAALAGWIAVEWAGILMSVVLQLTNDPITGCAISALATAAAAILAGTLAPADYHAVQVAHPPPQPAISPAPATEATPANLSSVEPVTAKPPTP